METGLDYNRQIINFTKTKKWVRLRNIHPNLNESFIERPQTKEKFLRTRVTLSQELAQETSLDKLEIRPRQKWGTLTAKSTENCHISNRNRSNNKRKTTRDLKEEEVLEGGVDQYRGEPKCKVLSRGRGEGIKLCEGILFQKIGQSVDGGLDMCGGDHNS